MAAPPPNTVFKKTDYGEDGLGSSDALEKFFGALNGIFSATRSALDGGLTLAQNLNAEVKTVTFTTPSVTYPDQRPFAYGRSTNGTSTSLANATYSSIVFESTVTDTDSAITTSAGLWKFTCPAGKGGLYNVSVSVGISGMASGEAILTLYKNGAEFLRGPRAQANTVLNILNLTFTGTLTLAAGDFIQVDVYQSSGATRTLEVNSVSNWITVTCLNLAQPAVYSCFPFKVSTKVVQPKSVKLAAISDITSGSTPLTTVVGGVDWTVNSSGAIYINNIPGLLPGRKYSATLEILGS